MTRSEYIKQAEQARKDSIEHRWLYLLKDEEPLIGCPFCSLETQVRPTAPRMPNETMTCGGACPFYTCGGTDSLYGVYAHSYGQAQIDAAQAIIDFLRAFNPAEWAEHLVEIGALSDD